MGIFHTMVELVNRTSEPLSVRFDGQEITLEPNYTDAGELIKGVHNMVPKVVIPFALNQCVLMGSEDAQNPSAFLSLVGVVEKNRKAGSKAPPKFSWHDTSFLEQSDEPTRVPLKEMLEDDPTVKEIKLKGQKAPRSIGMEGGGAGTTPFDLRVS